MMMRMTFTASFDADIGCENVKINNTKEPLLLVVNLQHQLLAKDKNFNDIQPKAVFINII